MTRFWRYLAVGVLLFHVSATIRAVDPTDLARITQEADTLGRALDKQGSPPDAAIFHKGALWALRYESTLDAGALALVNKALQRGRERLTSFDKGKPWADRKGKLARGYVSAVDGSVQPYGVIVPRGYDAKKPIRLDVVLHGSSRPVGLSELQFINRFDEGDAPSMNAPDVNYIELHPLGRVENCYRWSGETDVFEAIEAVCRNYNIDRDRIVLRGMSMGASGTWHLGLKHPDKFVALGPYCGYVDTFEFSRTPIPTFVKVGPLPAHQQRGLHMLDSIDYAANAGVVPAIACMGEKDIFFQAHVLMGNAMKREGLNLINLISPGTGHVIDPVTHAEQMRQIGVHVTRGLDHTPKRIRFVTWTLKYAKCHWLQIEGLEEHYRRAEIDAQLRDDGIIEMKEPMNITRFTILAPALRNPQPRLRIDSTEIALPMNAPKVTIVRNGDHWAIDGREPAVITGKRPGLQGPIDDAFTAPFLCVRGTGKSPNPKIQAWSDVNLKRFEYEWSRYFRGTIRVKNDVDVTEADIQQFNLILFGDPQSNRLIGRILPKLPISWTDSDLTVDGTRYAAVDHAPALIQPNPLAMNRYVVVNSGHTFHEEELNLLNYLLFPRLGDWAVLKIGDKLGDKLLATPAQPLDEQPIRAGYFDERWLFPKSAN